VPLSRRLPGPASGSRRASTTKSRNGSDPWSGRAARPVSGPVWFFDLDNTLHDASSAIFPVIAANMNAFIGEVLGRDGIPASQDAIDAARIGYVQRYGATLLGMMRHHQVPAADFLHAAHQFDDLRAMIQAERGLGRLLARLPGRKILLTNGPSRYSRDVMRHLRLKPHFSRHIAIEAMTVFRQLRPKPARTLLRKLAAREGVGPRQCILVEDTLVNLRAARAVGMRTVWITRYLAHHPNLHQEKSAGAGAGTASSRFKAALRKRPGCVDVKVRSIAGLPRHLSRLKSDL
jgi:putative hydrolase of the HAD superfamily